jgi:DNA-binding response OmpR family regulator
MAVSFPVIGSTARRHVLLVDDFEDALEVWTMFFEASGYTVTTAGTAASALERAAMPSLDAVVLDLQLPDASGLDVGRRLRATRDGLALVALTGRALTTDATTELEAVFDAVLIKPCAPTDLLLAIERTIATAQSEANDR